MRKYVIMGLQGSGKGTQAKRCVTPSTSSTSASATSSAGTSRATRSSAPTSGATSMPASWSRTTVVGQIVRARLDEHDWNFGFILDGFPRNERQAVFFLETFDIDAVIEIALSEAAATERILSRRLCKQCGLDYNLIYHRPARPGTCDVCGGALESRSDDTPQTIRARLDEYHVQAGPILDLFGRKELVVTVDGTRGPDDVHREICEKLGLPFTGNPVRARADDGD